MGFEGALNTDVLLEAGTLALQSTLTGTVTQTGGAFDVSAVGYPFGPSGTMQGVTWQGDLAPDFVGINAEGPGVLYVTDSLTLTDAAGTGPGTLTLDQADTSIVFEGTQTLDNATVYLDAAALQNDGTLTLGSHLLLDATADAIIGAGGLIINDGTISTVGTTLLSIEDSGYSNGNTQTFTNQGQIIVNADGILQTLDVDFVNDGTVTIAAGGVLQTPGVGFVNDGTVTVAAGGQLILQPAGGTLQNDGSLLDDGTLTLDGTLTTATLQALNVTYGAAAVLQLPAVGTLVNTGADLVLGAGGVAPGLSLLGEILGGTITLANANTLNIGTGLLDGVTVNGPLSVSGSSSILSIATSLQLDGGTLSVTGAHAAAIFDGSQTFADATILLGSSAGDTLAADGGILTLAATTQIRLARGESADIGGAVPNGKIVIDGSVSVANDAHLELGQNGSTVINDGDISISGNSSLFLQSGFVNRGAVSVQYSTLVLGNVNPAVLANITLLDSNVELVGTLTSTGTTLDVGAGTKLGTVLATFSAAIVGGTIHDTGSGLAFLTSNYGQPQTLRDVTYQGVLSIGVANAYVLLDDVTLQGLNGSGPGSIVLSGAGADLQLAHGTTLDNATVDISNGALIDGAGVLGAHLIIDQTGASATIGQSSVLISKGTINLGFAGGNMSLGGFDFHNEGTIDVSNGSTMTSAADVFFNTGVVELNAGTSMVLNLSFYYQFPPALLSSFENGGHLDLSGATITEQPIAGLPAVPLLNDSGAFIAGHGTISTELLNFGTVIAKSGALILTDEINGAGTLEVGGGATLSLLGYVAAGETASFTGTTGVLGLSAPLFLGEIGKFVAGDTIDLLQSAATAASFVSDSILVTLSAGGTLALTTTSALTGALTVTSDGHGGSLIDFAAAPRLADSVLDHHAAW